MATHRETYMPFGGVVVDVQQARNVAEVIALVPEFGKEVVGVPVYTMDGVQLNNYKAPAIEDRKSVV